MSFIPGMNMFYTRSIFLVSFQKSLEKFATEFGFYWKCDENLIRQVFFQDILRDVNSKVAEKERKQRLLEIYHRVDPKSTIMYNGRKFKKSDILSASRRLMFEGVGTLQQSRGRTLQVIMVVLSDIVIFLQENNQKYYFITPENKVCPINVEFCSFISS